MAITVLPVPGSPWMHDLAGPAAFEVGEQPLEHVLDGARLVGRRAP